MQNLTVNSITKFNAVPTLYAVSGPVSLDRLSDSELYKRAQEYGLRTKQWLRKFEGLLPEIARRKLYKRRGFAGIHEFAAKLAGMSHEKTDKILRLAHVLEDKPALKNLFESGSASYSKIDAVAHVATLETEKMWAQKVVTMPRLALEMCVKAERKKIGTQSDRLNFAPGGNFLPEEQTEEQTIDFVPPAMNSDAASDSYANLSTISFKISSELEYELRCAKQKMEKQRGETLGFAEVLQELLKVYASAAQFNVQTTRTKKAADHVQKTIQLCPKCIKERANEAAMWDATKRPIPKAVQDLVATRQQGKCAFSNCRQPPKIFHHTRRFALNRNHDPDYIVYVCVLHERLAHAGLIENEEAAPSEWRIEQPMVQFAKHAAAKFRIDEKVNAFRREPLLI